MFLVRWTCSSGSPPPGLLGEHTLIEEGILCHTWGLLTTRLRGDLDKSRSPNKQVSECLFAFTGSNPTGDCVPGRAVVVVLPALSSC